MGGIKTFAILFVIILSGYFLHDRLISLALTGYLEKSLNAEVTLLSPLSVSFGRTSQIEIDGLSIKTAEIEAAAKKVTIIVESLSMFVGPIDLHRVTLQKPVLHIVSNETATKTPIGELLDTRLTEFDELGLIVRDLSIASGTFSFKDTDQHIDLLLHRLMARRDSSSELQVNMAGALNDLDVTLDANLTRANHASHLTIDGVWGEFDVQADGSSNNLTDFDGLQLEVLIQAPSSKPALQLLGVTEVRDGPLNLQLTTTEVSGELHWQTQSSIGDIELNTTLQHQLNNQDFSLEFKASGPSLKEAGALLDYLEYLDSEFTVIGSVNRRGSNLQLKKLDMELAQGRMTARGNLPRWPEYDDWHLSVAANEFSIGILQPFSFCPIPDYSMDWQGNFSSTPAGQERFEILLSDTQRKVFLEGKLDSTVDWQGTEVELNASGFDMALLTTCAGIQANAIDPQANQPMTVTANLKRNADGWLSRLKVIAAKSQLETEFQSNTSTEATGKLKIQTDDLDELVSSFGMQPNTLQPIALDVGLDFSSRNRQLQIANGLIKSEFVSGTFHGKHQIGGFTSGIDFQLEGTDLRNLIQDAPKIASDHPFSVDVEWLSNRNEATFEGNVDIQNNRLMMTGTLPDVRQLAGMELSVRGSGPHLEQFLGAFVDHPLPITPYSISLDLHHLESRLEVNNLNVTSGQQTLKGNLLLDLMPNLSSTSGAFHLEGESITTLAQHFGLTPDMTDASYRVDFDVKGSKDKFTISLNSESGLSDLYGNIDVTPGSNYRFDIDLYSRRIHLPAFIPALAQTNSKHISARRDKVFTNVDIPWHLLSSLELNLSHQAKQVDLQAGQHGSTHVEFRIVDGLLESEKIQWLSPLSNGNARLIATRDQNKHSGSIKIDLISQRVPLIWLYTGTPNSKSKDNLNFRASVESSGSDVSALLKNLHGVAAFRGGGGDINSARLNTLFGDFLSQLTRRVFGTSDKVTKVECSAAAFTIAAGEVILEPGIAIRTSRFDVFSTGGLNLSDEALKLQLHSRSRRGIGVSAANTLVPKVNIGGTIAKPKIQLSPTNTAISSGAAIASSGLSVIASGLWNRIRSSVSNPCDTLYERALTDQKLPYAQLLQQQ